LTGRSEITAGLCRAVIQKKGRNSMQVESIMDGFGRAVDAAGVLAIVIGAVVATLLAAAALLRGRRGTVYATYRERLGRSILLGLELLVAADIIRTVAVTPTFESVGVLALIVLIRTFLSFTLELEMTGRWPWQKPDPDMGAEPQ
jgi:uncharacterized membrane protein